MNEEIVLVDGAGLPIGRAPKLPSHHSQTPLHLGFSCYIFNDKGEFLLTQRAKTKKVWPGVWTNSVCGHPAPDEEVSAAIVRRLNYELGLDEVVNLEVLLPDYRYKTPPFNGIIENEICPVYAGLVKTEPKINPDEVEAYKWVDWLTMLVDINNSPDDYSYWFKDQLKQLEDNLIIKDLTKSE